MAFNNGLVYLTKGNNSFEYWSYEPGSDAWTQRSDVPLGGGKKVKGGGALVYAPSRHALYALKGNNTTEFYRYDIAANAWAIK